MRWVATVLVLVGCGGAVCEPCREPSRPPVRAATPEPTVSTTRRLDEDFQCIARMTHGSGEAGATFAFSRHADGTPSSRASTLALEDASCTFEGRFGLPPGHAPVPGTGSMRSIVRCVRGDETRSEESEDGAAIALTFGDVAVRFDCTDTGPVEILVDH